MTEKVLADVIEIKVDGKGRDIAMTYGLLNEVAKAAGGPNGLLNLFADDERRDAVVTALLSERDEAGKVVRVVGPTDARVAPAEVLRLLAWAGEHVMDFFARYLEAAVRLDAEANRMAAALGASSSPGSAG